MHALSGLQRQRQLPASPCYHAAAAGLAVCGQRYASASQRNVHVRAANHSSSPGAQLTSFHPDHSAIVVGATTAGASSAAALADAHAAAISSGSAVAEDQDQLVVSSAPGSLRPSSSNTMTTTSTNQSSLSSKDHQKQLQSGTAAAAAHHNHDDEDKPQQQFNWYKQWWPVAILDQLDPAVPNQAQLMGMDLVLWRDQQGQWRAFRDCCPHRLAPLSEGRIDDKTGNLYCNYHGWQFDSTGACANIPQVPSEVGSKPPNPKRSCAQSFPTKTAEELLWVWGDSSPTAAAEAAATPAAALAPEVGQFGREAFWSTKLFMEGNTALGFWYQRFCNASYRAVKENVFNDPSHDTVLHHGRGGLNRDLAQPGVVQEFHLNDKGYRIKRLNIASGRVVSETCVFPSAVRRDFAGDPRFGGGIGYVTPTSKGKCNMLLSIVRDPECAAQPQGWWNRLLAAVLPPTPEWLNHITLHDVVDADVAMQHGVDVNSSRGLGRGGYMPAIGMDQGPIAFRRWLQKFGGGGPPTDNDEAWRSSDGPDPPLSRRELLDRYHSHTKHCSHCSAALKNFQALQQAANTLSQVLAAAALAVAAVALAQHAAAAATAAAAASGAGAGVAAAAPVAAAAFSGLAGAVLLLVAAAAAAAGAARWADSYIQRFIFVDYDKHNISKL